MNLRARIWKCTDTALPGAFGLWSIVFYDVDHKGGTRYEDGFPDLPTAHNFARKVVTP
jgi:hypothetical protein